MHRKPNYLIMISRKTGKDLASIVQFAKGESHEKLFINDLRYKLKKIIQTEIQEVLFKHQYKQVKVKLDFFQGLETRQVKQK